MVAVWRGPKRWDSGVIAPFFAANGSRIMGVLRREEEIFDWKFEVGGRLWFLGWVRVVWVEGLAPEQ